MLSQGIHSTAIDSTPYASNITQDRYTSSEDEGLSCQHVRKWNTFYYPSTGPKTPSPLPIPDGYRVIARSSKLSGDWSRQLTLDGSYNFYYERKPTRDFRLKCPLPCCAKVIQGCEIRKHLKDDHPGFSQDGRYRKVACIECDTMEMEVRCYANHVLETHCDVSARCAYCGNQLTRGESVTHHHIVICEALIPYRC
ncbi:hypothetical protein ARMGADRAFT_770645 [Armillaria gallica]|uniref:Uncharacterized protein n=1 Tax=Armillaria gallica TaxID=47427 RepID=A0A2H3D0D3_ARMGA|nr:hypothetical protein ARMGADRAFT_770645 [Armillaria gallica]